MSNDSLPIPKVEVSHIVHDGFIKIRCDRLRLPNGHKYHYYSLDARAPAVVVLAVTSDHKLLLIEEYRHPTLSILLSCVGGYLDSENEKPEEAARRELLEETGYTAERFLILGSAYPYPGISSQKLYYVLAENVIKERNPELESSEILKPVLMTRSELVNAIAEGKPIDGNLCTALFLESTLFNTDKAQIKDTNLHR